MVKWFPSCVFFDLACLITVFNVDFMGHTISLILYYVPFCVVLNVTVLFRIASSYNCAQRTVSPEF